MKMFIMILLTGSFTLPALAQADSKYLIRVFKGLKSAGAETSLYCKIGKVSDLPSSLTINTRADLGESNPQGTEAMLMIRVDSGRLLSDVSFGTKASLYTVSHSQIAINQDRGFHAAEIPVLGVNAIEPFDSKTEYYSFEVTVNPSAQEGCN